MSFFCYYTPSVTSFMERDSDRLAADIVRKLSQPNPLAVLLRQEQAAQAILKKRKRWSKKARKARKMMKKLNAKIAKRRTVIETRISERYIGAKPYTHEQLTKRN